MDIDHDILRHVGVLVTIDIHRHREEIGFRPCRSEPTGFEAFPPRLQKQPISLAVEAGKGWQRCGRVSPCEEFLRVRLALEEMDLNHQLADGKLVALLLGEIPAQSVHSFVLGAFDVHFQDIAI